MRLKTFPNQFPGWIKIRPNLCYLQERTSMPALKPTSPIIQQFCHREIRNGRIAWQLSQQTMGIKLTVRSTFGYCCRFPDQLEFTQKTRLQWIRTPQQPLPTHNIWTGPKGKSLHNQEDIAYRKRPPKEMHTQNWLAFKKQTRSQKIWAGRKCQSQSAAERGDAKETSISIPFPYSHPRKSLIFLHFKIDLFEICRGLFKGDAKSQPGTRSDYL